MEYIIEMLGITKEFPGIVANDDVVLQIRKGEIHALLGENGAGKSTLMNVLFGLYQPERGTIKLRGKEVHIADPRQANELGIGMVHQHFMLVEDFPVLDNIVLGVETVRRGFLQMAEARQKVMELSERYGLRINPDDRVADITVGMQQRVEILKMLYRDNDILIFDEPTAVLTPQEITELMQIMRDLAAEGKSIIFITHKLKEIKAVADRCTVLRRGKTVGVVDVADTDEETLSEMMVGRKVDLKISKAPARPGEEVLRVSGLSVARQGEGQSRNAVNDVSFSVRRGEIVCIAGVDGNGQSELVAALTGLVRPVAGDIYLNGENITAQSVRYRNTHGLAHIPEDRHKYGLVLEYTLAENLILQRYFEPRFQRRGFLRREQIDEYGAGLIEAYDIRSGQGLETPARSMSGGNQQKAIIAREIDRAPDLLIAVQPTRGLDVGAIEFVRKQLVQQRDAGKAILLVSLELDEVFNLSDRILVIHAGSIVADVDPTEISEQQLGLYMAGAQVSN
ncbi:MAG: ABC transporter ATP-binding protein [Bacillota bacterium]|jgi:ABC-type uncharacterized transport system ATPase subunit